MAQDPLLFSPYVIFVLFVGLGLTFVATKILRMYMYVNVCMGGSSDELGIVAHNMFPVESDIHV